MLHQHFLEGAAAAYLLFMLTAEFRLLLQAKMLKSQKVPLKEISGRVGEHRDWKLEKMLRQSEGYSLARLDKTYRRLLETESALVQTCGRLKIDPSESCITNILGSFTKQPSIYKI